MVVQLRSCVGFLRLTHDFRHETEFFVPIKSQYKSCIMGLASLAFSRSALPLVVCRLLRFPLSLFGITISSYVESSSCDSSSSLNSSRSGIFSFFHCLSGKTVEISNEVFSTQINLNETDFFVRRP